LRGAEVTRKIEGVTGSKHHQDFVVAVKLNGLQGTELISITSVLVVKELPNFNASIRTNEVVSKYYHLSGLNFPEISKQKVEILIGAHVWQAHVIHESVEGEPDQPRALRTGLGWTLFGPDPRTRGSKGYAVNCVQSANDIQYERKKRMFNYDFPDNSQVSDAPYSVEDKQFPQKAETSITKLNGHYQRELPSKKDAMLTDNRSMAENPAHLIGGNTSQACASYALRKVADETETHISSETVLRVKKRFDVDDCLKYENSVDEATQTVNELNCFCDLSVVGYGAVCYLCLVFYFAIRCSSVLERPRVAHKLEFCAATIAFKLPRLVGRLVTKKLELRIAWEVMARSVKRIVHCICFSLLHQRQIGLQLSRNLRVGRHYSDIVL